MKFNKHKITGGFYRQPKNDIFIIQIIEGYLKIVKCRQMLNKREFTDFEITPLSGGLADEELTKKAKSLLEKLKFNNNRVILSLPRYQATLRYIKIPAKIPAEIEKIIPFQASKYLPYPPQELVTAYQVISTDKEGYSHINLNIVHKDVISGYLSFLNALGIKNFSVILNSYGLCSLHNETEPSPGISMIVDIDDNYAELAVTSQKKLFFSRSFKALQGQNLENILSDEIKKTNSAYVKETGHNPVERVIIFTDKNISAQKLSENISLPAETVDYSGKVCPRLSERIKAEAVSAAGLFGLGLKELSASLNILPQDVKDVRISASRKKELMTLSVTALLIILTLTAAVTKDLDNKRRYRDKLKLELDKVSKEAKALEEINTRFGILESEARY
ncbi:MAG: pilus assembly protein PilM, partial [Candidatus Omnitrophica bacterium]|nr:pilus assembly protein PilM [Candidatus Omnitrophota bacterium]